MHPSSMGRRSMIVRRLKSRICCTRPAARWACSWIVPRRVRTRSAREASRRSISVWSRIGPSRLLKSWAMPAAMRPMAARLRCCSASCSRRCCSVTSRSVITQPWVSRSSRIGLISTSKTRGGRSEDVIWCSRPSAPGASRLLRGRPPSIARAPSSSKDCQRLQVFLGQRVDRAHAARAVEHQEAFRRTVQDRLQLARLTLRPVQELQAVDGAADLVGDGLHQGGLLFRPDVGLGGGDAHPADHPVDHRDRNGQRGEQAVGQRVAGHVEQRRISGDRRPIRDGREPMCVDQAGLRAVQAGGIATFRQGPRSPSRRRPRRSRP